MQMPATDLQGAQSRQEMKQELTVAPLMLIWLA